MPYGWTGTNLEVDLTRGTVQKVKGDPELVRAYLGGKGIGLKILWDRVPPETDPFSPESVMVISPGLFVGTSLPAANRCVISFVSPVSGYYHHSAMGGYFAPELKHAGYDNIIISGKSPTPVYLWINDDQVQLRDAGHLWGQGTFETRRIIRQDLGNEDIEIACIGQAGENKLFQASIMGGIGSAAAMAGPGAIWGDKKFKAIAVYGTRDVAVANPTGFGKLSQYVLSRSNKNNYSTVGTNRLETRSVWYGYYNEQDYGQLPPDSELKKSIDKIEEKMGDLVKTRGTRVMGCHNCRRACITAFDYHGRPIHVKCTSFLIFLVYSKYIDYDWALDCFSMTEDWGLDIESFPLAVAFAIDLYQRGILTKEDTDGLHLEFGNPEVFTTLMQKIVNREGIGDVLANGIARAARQIGRGAEERVFVTKGREMRLTASHAYVPPVALELIIGTKDWGGQRSGEIQRILKRPWQGFVGGTEEAEEAYRNGGWYFNPREREEREAYIKAGRFVYPKEYEEVFMREYNVDGSDCDTESFCSLIIYDNQIFSITDSLGICHRTKSGWGGPTIKPLTQLVELIANATGMNIDEDELLTIGKRILTLARAFNLRRGMSRKDDIPPKIFFERNPPPPWQKLDRDVFDKYLDTYYELTGWDQEGIPTAETLEKLGLDDVRQELEEEGILALRQR